MQRQVLLIVLSLIFGINALNSQSFQKEYTVADGTLVVPYSVAQRPDGCFLVSHLVREGALRLHVTCIDPAGDVLWSTRLNAHFNGDDASEGIKKTPIMATADNSCVVLVAKSLLSTGQGWAMVKLSPDGVIQWNREITGVGSVSDLLAYTPGRIYLHARYWSFDSKPFMACLDDNGNVIWEKNLQSNLENITATSIRVLPDQSLLLSLAESSFLLQRGHIARMNSSGTLVNLLTLPNLSLMGVDQHPDGRLFFLARTLDSINLKNHVLLGAAQNGQVQWVKAIDIPQDFYYSGMLTLNAGKDSIVTSFQASFFEAQRYWIRFDLNGNPGETHFIPTAESSGNEMITTQDGGFAWVTAGPASSNQRSFVLSKTNARALLDNCPAGTICGMTTRDTFFPTLPPADWSALDVTRIITGTATQQPQTVTVNDFCLPLPVLDASILTSDSTGCGDEPFEFQRKPLATGISMWTFTNANPNTFQGAEPPDVIFPGAGNYLVRHVLNQAGCLDTASLIVRVGAYPQLILPADTVFCPGDPILIGVQASSGLSYLWNDGATSSSRSIAAPGEYALTVTNMEGCSRQDSIAVHPPALPGTLWQSDTFYCPNAAVSVHLGSSPGWQYQWADGFPEPERIFSTAGVFYVQALSPEACMLTDSTIISERIPPELDISVLLPADCGTQLLRASGPALDAFRWNTGDDTADVYAEQGGVFTVTASDGFCEAVDSVQVEFIPCPECSLYIPSVFKPGSGSGNSTFGVQSGCLVTDFLLQVYDRWGNLVYGSLDPHSAWDGNLNGKPVSPGVYLFRLQLTHHSGDLESRVIKTGDVSVVR
ncbi:MAG: gliding motility-associated C-terminal domain-containing protein [Saprospiraceae bacterium]|nr:gliding motility-associated C-terminal domain-containing protein [Saprospiraceae bacterium]